MGFREQLKKLEEKKEMLAVKTPVSKRLEASGILKAVEPKPVLFEKIKESEFRAAGNIFPTKDSVADYLGCKTSELIPVITKAIENMNAPEETKKAPRPFESGRFFSLGFAFRVGVTREAVRVI